MIHADHSALAIHFTAYPLYGYGTDYHAHLYPLSFLLSLFKSSCPYRWITYEICMHTSSANLSGMQVQTFTSNAIEVQLS